MSNHWLAVGLSSLPSPMRFGQDGAPLLTPVFRNTVKGRPGGQGDDPAELPVPEQRRRPKPPCSQRRSLPKGSSHT